MARQITLTLEDEEFIFLRDYIARDARAYSIYLVALHGSGDIAGFLKAAGFDPARATATAEAAPAAGDTMTWVRALNLAALAINYLLTGEPTLDAFDIAEFSPAIRAIVGESDLKPKEPFLCAYTSLIRVGHLLRGHGSRRRAGGKEKARLERTLAAIRAVIEQATDLSEFEAAFAAAWERSL